MLNYRPETGPPAIAATWRYGRRGIGVALVVALLDAGPALGFVDADALWCGRRYGRS